MSVKKEVLEFWDKKDFKEQQRLIAGSVPWGESEAAAQYHCSLIVTKAIKSGLNELNELFSTPQILEVGCGVGRLLKHFYSVYEYEVTGVDISPNMIERAKEYLAGTIQFPELYVVDGTLPIKDATVDLVYSFLVFQHIQTTDEVRKYIDEAIRVLRPGGFLRVQTHAGQPYPGTSFGGFHGRFYPTLKGFAAEFVRPGVKVVEEDAGMGHKDWLWVTVRKDL